MVCFLYSYSLQVCIESVRYNSFRHKSIDRKYSGCCLEFLNDWLAFPLTQPFPTSISGFFEPRISLTVFIIKLLGGLLSAIYMVLTVLLLTHVWLYLELIQYVSLVAFSCKDVLNARLTISGIVSEFLIDQFHLVIDLNMVMTSIFW